MAMLMVTVMSNKEEPEPDGISGGFIKVGGGSGGYQVTQDKRMLSNPDPGYVHPKGAGKGRKTALALLGLSPKIIKAGDPDYAKCLAQANTYRKRRMKELAHLHGHISAGVGALLASASLSLAASRYLYQLGSTGTDVSLLKTASQLADSSRQSELAAWEMSAKEGVLARRKEASATGMPWMLAPGDENQVTKMGRKTNAVRNARELDGTAGIVDAVPEVTPDE